MPARSLSRLPAALLAWAALAATTICGTALTVTDQKGRSIEIEIVALAGDSLTFRRQGQPKEFTLPVSQFDQGSRELIRKQAGAMPAAAPKIKPEIIIGKRRREANNSYFMVKQEVTCTVKLTNLSPSARIPAVSGKIVFIGQNTRTPALLTVLATQSFEASINPTETFTQELESFFTSYDSDNKGTGNVGGYQYFGYVLALMDPAGNVVLDQTTTGSFRLALAASPSLLKEVIKYPKGKMLTDKLEDSGATGPAAFPQ